MPVSQFTLGAGKLDPTKPMLPTPPTFTETCFLGICVAIMIFTPFWSLGTLLGSCSLACSSSSVTTSLSVKPCSGITSGMRIVCSFCITPVLALNPPAPLGAPAEPRVRIIHSGFGTGRLSWCAGGRHFSFTSCTMFRKFTSRAITASSLRTRLINRR